MIVLLNKGEVQEAVKEYLYRRGLKLRGEVRVECQGHTGTWNWSHDTYRASVEVENEVMNPKPDGPYR
jgi:hypothetical protein